MSASQGAQSRPTNDKQHEDLDTESLARIPRNISGLVDLSEQQQNAPQTPSPVAFSSKGKERDPQVPTFRRPSHHDSIKMANIAPHVQTDPEMRETKRDNSEVDFLSPRKKREKREKRFNSVLRASQSECYKILTVHDDDTGKIKGWNSEIDNLLIFAGLFSVVVTIFIVQTYPGLNPPSTDPSAAILVQMFAQLSSVQISSQAITSTVPSAQNPAQSSSASASLIVVNTLWFVSLIFSLVSASIGILLKQWLREYESIVTKNNIGDKLRLYKLRHDGLVRWRVKEIAMVLPLLLQSALIMFLIGLVVLAWTLNPIVAVFVTVFISAALTFTAITTVLPAVILACPYKSPQARIFFHVCQRAKSIFRSVSRMLHSIVSIFSRHTHSTNLSSYVPLHDWSEWEDLYIDRSWFGLDAHVLRAVQTAYAGATSGNLYTTIGPIAVNALGMIWSEFDEAEECPSGELAESLHEHLDVAEEYCNYSEDSSIPVEQDLLSCLVRLLKWDLFQERSWSIIRWHGYRFDVDVFPLRDLFPIIRFVKRQISDVSTASSDIESIQGSSAVIRLCTRLPDYLFEDSYIQDELRQFLGVLHPHIRDVSKFASGGEIQSIHTFWFLTYFFNELLQLAQKHNDVVTVDLVTACEYGFKGLDEKLVDSRWWQHRKPDIVKSLQAIRKLVDEQQAARDLADRDRDDTIQRVVHDIYPYETME